MNVINEYSVAAGILIALGIYCAATKRNLLRIVIGIEVLTNGINLNFIAMGLSPQGLDQLAQMYAALSISIGASVAAVALALIMNAYKHYGTLDSSKMRRLRW